MSARSGRVNSSIGNLRVHAARGTLVNSAFQAGLAGLGLLQRVAVAAFLTREQFGIWGIVLGILVTLVWLKQIGIMDKYVQQSDPDQEAAFQTAFTLELLVSLAYFVLVLLVIPLYALLYGRTEIIAPAIVAALAVPITAFESPAWIAYRQLDYVRQRLLTAIDPVVTIVLTIALAAAGLGYWSLIIGAVAGSLFGALVCTASSPYRLRWRFNRIALKAYVRFSWPLLGGGFSRLLVVQGGLVALTHAAGVATVGSVALATSVAILADRIDGIISQTIYPAVCAVADRTELLYETFVKSNRIALMWAMPFAGGIALFAHDVARFVLGARWLPAVPLAVAVSITSGVAQVAFNWSVFMRALDRTRPLLVGALVDLAVFLCVALPAILALGAKGYVVGIGSAALAQLAVRQYFLGQLFRGFNVARQLLRGLLPIVPALAAILVLRGFFSGERSVVRSLAESVLYVTLVAGGIAIAEQRLVREIIGYLRPARQGTPAVSAA